MIARAATARITSSEAKALRQAVRNASGRTFNKQAASYVDADLVADGRTRTMAQRYENPCEVVDELRARMLSVIPLRVFSSVKWCF